MRKGWPNKMRATLHSISTTPKLFMYASNPAQILGFTLLALGSWLGQKQLAQSKAITMIANIRKKGNNHYAKKIERVGLVSKCSIE